MADQGTPHTAKESNLKGFRDRLKKVFGWESQSTLEAAKLRAKYTHFRILVIGRANAGKTTLLKRVCNTKEDPVYSEVRYICSALYPTLIIPSPTDEPNLKGDSSAFF